MNYKSKVAVVIPFYKSELTDFENIALQQLLTVLKSYPVVVVKPRNLELSIILDQRLSEIISFDDKYFKDIQGYNALMLSEEFYQAFSDYEYILLHQLDAFVFSDKLKYWCDQGYDYIGAPWPPKTNYKNAFDEAYKKLKNYYSVRFNVKHWDGLPKIGKQLTGRTGNGGFSLRRVNKFLTYTIKFKPKIEEYLAMRHPWFNEDIFWSIELNRKKQNLKIPGFKKALHFAIETNPELCLRINNNQLPFGCHAWDKHTDFWRPIFKSYHIDI